MRRIKLRTLIVVIAFFALLLALFVQGWRANNREKQLRIMLEAERIRALDERDRVQALLQNSVITVAPPSASKKPDRDDRQAESTP
jgi:hypothetical protein